MKRPKPTRKDDFMKVARELGCDESEAAFDKALGKIGRAKVAPKMQRRPGERKKQKRR